MKTGYEKVQEGTKKLWYRGIREELKTKRRLYYRKTETSALKKYMRNALFQCCVKVEKKKNNSETKHYFVSLLLKTLTLPIVLVWRCVFLCSSSDETEGVVWWHTSDIVGRLSNFLTVCFHWLTQLHLCGNVCYQGVIKWNNGLYILYLYKCLLPSLFLCCITYISLVLLNLHLVPSSAFKYRIVLTMVGFCSSKP